MPQDVLPCDDCNIAAPTTTDKKSKPRKALGDLAPRIRSGVIYFLLSAAAIALGDVALSVYLAATAAICAKEFLFIGGEKDKYLSSDIIAITSAALYPLFALIFGIKGIGAFSIGVIVALGFSFVVDSRVRTISVCRGLFAAFYTGVLISGFVLIARAFDGWQGALVVLLVFASVWLSDAFAYLVGCRIGKHKLAPKLSPKKSVEGFIAGIVASVAVWIGISFVPVVNMPIWGAVITGIACGMFGLMGDLFESRIKRECGVKDSGTMMPGHGGLLDRTDSLLFVAFVAYACMLVFGALLGV